MFFFQFPLHSIGERIPHSKIIWFSHRLIEAILKIFEALECTAFISLLCSAATFELSPAILPNQQFLLLLFNFPQLFVFLFTASFSKKRESIHFSITIALSDSHCFFILSLIYWFYPCAQSTFFISILWFHSFILLVSVVQIFSFFDSFVFLKLRLTSFPRLGRLARVFAPPNSFPS